jgi:hypothetical protein
VFGLDEDDEGEVSFGESSDAEREMTPEIPKAPSVKTFDDDGNFERAGDVDSGTLRAFVVAVIYANAAVLLVTLGPMVWYFEGWSRVGPVLLVAGLLAGVRTYQTYRAWKRSRDEAGDGDTDSVGDDSDPDGSVVGDESLSDDSPAADDSTDDEPNPAPPEA